MRQYAELPRGPRRRHRRRRKKLIEWDSKNAKSTEGWRKRSARGDLAARRKLLGRPELSDEAEPYYAAFRALQRDRPYLAGMSMALPLPVPRQAIALYAGLIDIDEDETGEFVEIVAAIDDTFVEVETVRIAAEVKAEAAKKKRKER